jgi:hypothetical protein
MGRDCSLSRLAGSVRYALRAVVMWRL